MFQQKKHKAIFGIYKIPSLADLAVYKLKNVGFLPEAISVTKVPEGDETSGILLTVDVNDSDSFKKAKEILRGSHAQGICSGLKD